MNKKYLEAKRKVKSLRRFYIHLLFFLIVNVALMFNLIMLEKDESLNIFVWAILNIMITWSIGVFIHAWIVFKGKILFSKAYEDRKIEEFMNEEQNL
ncbi:2TM domain-containing protein [Pontimicrobium sp. SW4]|uniref:2TM domain-containing protein n=1 Tax=Pontimicrobium sp. SW4 TaxID=3153519 RepID=A0AAU7BW19_9FLAO